MLENRGILFLGQKTVGERAFEILCAYVDTSFQIRGVVTNFSEDVWWRSNRIYRQAQAMGIPCLDNCRRQEHEIRTLVREGGITDIISVQHPWIVPADILASVSYRGYNFHNAKLPEYQGHNCCNHAILNGETTYTSTLHWMVDDVDQGGIIDVETVPIEPSETARSLYDKANDSALILFRRLMEDLRAGKLLPNKPLTLGGMFYPRNSLEVHREIRNRNDAEEMDRKARALYFPPFESAYFQHVDRKFYVLPEGFERYSHEFKVDIIHQESQYVPM